VFAGDEGARDGSRRDAAEEKAHGSWLVLLLVVEF
jgi:hypothetical protein